MAIKITKDEGKEAVIILDEGNPIEEAKQEETDLSMLTPEEQARLVIDQKLVDAGIKVSLFIDADREQIDAAKECGAPFIELHTGHYADAETEEDQQDELKKIAAGASYAADQGITVNAGHGLTYHNVSAIAAIPEIFELNIGHSIMGRAMFDGLDKAVADMRSLMVEARHAAVK